MQQKLFAFDVDGTLVDNKKNVLDSTKKAIKSLINKNHVVCLCTGRTPIQTFDIADELGLKHFIIGSGGAVIYNIENEQTTNIAETLDKKDLQLMWDFAKKYKRELGFNNGLKFWRVYFGEDINKDIDDEKFFRGGTSRNPIYDDIEKAKEALFSEKIIQAAIKLESYKLLDLQKEIKPLLSKDVHHHITSEVYFEISRKNIHKFYAIEKIQKELNILNENTYCFGDSDNDYEMIKFSGNGIAMGNATLKIREIADKIIGDNNNDSIYEFLLEQKLI